MPRVSLTPRTVEALEVPQGKQRIIYYDTHREAPKGFALRITANGARSYYLLQTLRGTKTRVWVRIGEVGAVTLDDARRAATAKAGDIARDVNPNAEARESARKARAERLRHENEAAEPTVTELIRRYREARLETLSPITAAEYERLLQVELGPSSLGKRKARSVVRGDMREFLLEVVKGKQSWKKPGKRRPAPHIAARLLALWRAAVKWGQTEGIRVENDEGEMTTRPLFDKLDPSLGVEAELRVPLRATPRKRHLTDEEIPLFWTALDGLKLAWSSFLRIILLAGTRRGETHSARWSDIELDGASPTWHIPAEHRKGRVRGSQGERRGLDVPLSPLAVTLLRDLHRITWMKRGVFIAQGFSVALVGGEVRRVLEQAAAAASHASQRKALEGLSDVTIHDLRRSTAYGLERLGAPPHVISLALGHSRTAGALPSDHHYIGNVRPGEVRHWLQRWSDHVGRLIGSPEKGCGGAVLRDRRVRTRGSGLRRADP